MTKAGSQGGNLRDKLDSNQLALSLSDLNEVLVEELAAPAPPPKATILDLPCSKRSTLPSDFRGLTHLVKLGLRKNKRRQLPAGSAARSTSSTCTSSTKQRKQGANRVLEHPKAVQLGQEPERQRQPEIDREAEETWEAKQRAQEAPERNCGSREGGREGAPPPPGNHTRSWAALRPLLLRVAGGLVACRVTELQQRPVCTSVNTIYDNALRRCAGTPSSRSPWWNKEK
ncbi:hypothetical protein J1605_010239 [Eschrichtius robustus]|uniref:Uncharacterized protein n=1 Tax=Eschrichtius robustus TaxID=9764 RepID=A0AB34GUG2_ESCRO|nr:hypothetical protein J1605_010239 [Eschrichtius robustus]